MLEHARASIADRAIFHVADLRDPLPGGNFDAVISALAIHHLEDHEKRDLFARTHAALNPGGAFINAEQIAAPDEALERNWHEQASLKLGASTKEWSAAEQRMRLDRCATAQHQLTWLSENRIRPNRLPLQTPLLRRALRTPP